ncbi:MAG: hypothetical protein KUG75_04855 [Pseudomonadales bacterium]|nr:hypothetical protein [Pseudomonadales bacterium]
MAHHKYELVDLLEIFHARSLRNQLISELRRLSDEEYCLPGTDLGKREEIRSYYESMLIVNAELLQNLGSH